MSQAKKYDVIIVGAGPAGCAAAIKLASADLRIAIIDKAKFPRDKICGDALSIDVVNQLPMLSARLAQIFKTFSKKTPSYGVKIFAPNRRSVDIPFYNKGKKGCGYISTRVDFDNLLFEEVARYKSITILETHKVEEIVNNGVIVSVTCSSKSKLNEEESSSIYLEAPLIVGADGAHSVVSKHLSDIKVELDHYSAGLRVYYENVADFHGENFIELHFFKGILPGYLWVFPLPDNKANVGIGMLSSAVSKKKVNLKKELNKAISEDPGLRKRFANANALETVKGFGLPLGSKKRVISGDRFLLTGDAAGLIDPFSGEGIANAIRSGRVAADHILKCFETNSFSAEFNKAYDREIYSRMWKEFRISRSLQRLCAYPRLFNFVVNKAAQSKYLTKLLTDALAEVDVKQVLTKPGFYLRLLFK